MSHDNFLSYLQQLLSTVDPGNPCSVALGQTALDATVELVRASGKVDGYTIHLMVMAQDGFRHLVYHQKEYAGVPGEYKENEQKRRRLEMVLHPGC